MLTHLIASRAAHTSSAPAQTLAIALHLLILSGAVFATRGATRIEPYTPEQAPRIWFPTNPPQPATPTIVVPRVRGFRLLPSIFDIPSVLPEVDVSRPFTDPDDFVPRGQPGDPLGTITASSPSVMTAEQVDRPAFLLPGSARPVFPEALRSAGVGGEVTAQFVIDSTGRADMASLSILMSSHPLFHDAVKRALAKARFAPAEFAGRRVPQIVRMPFVFSLEKR